MTASKTELRTLERLTSELGLARGVVNVLLYYVLNEKEGTMPSYNYFEKVANEWARKGVKDTKSALLHTKQLKEQPKGGAVKYTNKKTGVRPDWMDQYEEETEAKDKEKQKQEQEYFDNLSEEEKAKLEEKIKKVLG
ncbi:MAG TPA: DnaD domain protein [Bacilli bacterium]|nr:DnaD domain protein [Bacilli bacterium]